MARWLAAALVLALLGPVGAATSARRAEVEADWVNQEMVRHLSGAPVTPAEDAAGAVDGVKDGKWGFHTGLDDGPWWQVDLGAVQPLARVLVFNRCDCAGRADRLAALLSHDGRTWRPVYQHTGPTFYGASDNQPLTIALPGNSARFVRLQLPGKEFLHLDEVEVYGPADPARNLALGRPAGQSSTSQWSLRHVRVTEPAAWPAAEVAERGRAMLRDQQALGADTAALRAELEGASRAAELPAGAPLAARQAAYFRVRWVVRRIALAHPGLDFDRLVFAKRLPGSFSHMSDQNYGWWSRPGGGLYILDGLRSDEPRLRCLTAGLPAGSVNSPDLSYDGQRIVFAWCRWYPETAGNRNKVDKASLPDDAFYHLYEVRVDGSGLRQLTRGRYDDFDGRYLPSGDIAFLSTRRGQTTTVVGSAPTTLTAAQPDSYVRCGGDNYRPVAVYTMHTMRPDGSELRTLSPFENFEWTPSIADDGRIYYARWDYVDRDNMPYMSLWSTNPDGTNPQIVYGNHTRNPHCIFEARSVPGSRKLMFTASGHHSITGGSLALIDPAQGLDGAQALTRLTPEVCFPESEGWPATFYANPYPLTERAWLCAWSNKPLQAQGQANFGNGLGLYLGDASGNLELIHRDAEVSSMYPLPLKPRLAPPVLAAGERGSDDPGRFLIADVYRGLPGVARGTIKRLRVVATPAKTQPHMNTPSLGMTNDDPGKCVLGTVPVEADGSAYFQVPAGVGLFFQALDGHDQAVQTMRSLTYVQPRQTLTCVGCHEPRNTAPPNVRPQAVARAASRLRPGPTGSWPLRFDQLVQPLLDVRCVSCHQPGGSGGRWNLQAAAAYETLVGYGRPSLREHVLGRYRQGHSTAGQGAAATSPLLRLLSAPAGHQQVVLSAAERERLVTWMDTYGQRLGSFSPQQEQELSRLRQVWAALLEP